MGQGKDQDNKEFGCHVENNRRGGRDAKRLELTLHTSLVAVASYSEAFYQ